MPRLFTLIVLSLLTAPSTAAEPNSARRELSFDGPWEFRKDGSAENTWKTIGIPSVFQEHEGKEWHGVGWYRKTIDRLTVPNGRRLLLHFSAAATHAEVWWDDQRLGEHLGGWTPFRFDVTELVRKKPDGQHTVRVRLDEKVGHNTQGFLPIIEPHFGGLWQTVKLLEVPDSYIDDLHVAAFGILDRSVIELTVPFNGASAPARNSVRYRLNGGSWSMPVAVSLSSAKSPVKIPVDVQEPKTWSLAEPNLYEVEVTLGNDRVVTQTAFRSVKAEGSRLLLNGKPLIVRGVLNWGYYPPRLAPMPDLERWRRDIRLAKAMGFNLMKCCLWTPPREFFDLCDREGMLVWQEYPTWHPRLDRAHETELTREYAEFFAHDRNHPSVILRSLTCETGASADLAVIKDLYELAKKEIPGCLVEDDSSWIEWNRVSDFFDDHPYGNNHTWIGTLRRLREYAEKHGPKPLILGEAIAADTWVDPEPLLKRVGSERPYWLPRFLGGNKKWLERMQTLYGPGGLERLGPDSLQFAMQMRKYQIETFRREVPDGGYVVSVLRDFPLAAMGLLDYSDQPKWSPKEWAWHADPKQSIALPIHIPKAEHAPSDVIFAKRFDEPILTKLEAGGKVVLLPDGEKGSFPLADHWFLRGGPYFPDHPLWGHISRDAMVRFQQFDLARRVIPDVQYLDEIDPVILLWDNHDIQDVRTHALVFETRVGRGRLLVSALNHALTNEFGRALLDRFAQHVSQGPMPKRSLKSATIHRIREKLREKKLDLTRETWRFKPDAKNVGVAEGWQKADHKLDESWSSIRVGQHWEGQGWPLLDGWAWYRLDVTAPREWAGRDVFLSFEGVDDHYEAFVNGTKVGAGGDPITKRTAFDERVSFKVTSIVKPGERCTIAVRVLDWYGAGGIHRPVTLGTAELGRGADIIR